MSKLMLIEAGPFETRVAVLEDGELVEVHIERTSQASVVGNIYKGRVQRVLPGLQAAFVDIGLSRDAFLFAGDLPQDSEGEMAEDTGGPTARGSVPPIEAVVRQGDELLVQVVKEPLGEKGARISGQISIPGRFLVLLPGSGDVGISRRIAASSSREDLERRLGEIRPHGAGLIARTAAHGRSSPELERDLEALEKRWRTLVRRAASMSAPALVERESSLALRAIRDLAGEDVEAIVVEGPQQYDELLEYVEHLEPLLVERLRPHEGDLPLFDSFRLEQRIAKATQRRVWLPAGGCIVIDSTEALVAIDVNTGRSTEGTELEETALATNLEAVEEICREIRLRDLGGIIVVDFIDMVEVEHRRQVLSVLEERLASDRSRSQISQMSDFGLVAITRKRTRAGLSQQLSEPCPCCGGEGRVRNAESIGLEVARALRRRAAASREAEVEVRLHPRVKRALEENHRELCRELERRTAGRLDLVGDASIGLDRFEISIGGK